MADTQVKLDLTVQEQQTLVGLSDHEYKRTSDISNRRKLLAQRYESFFKSII